MKAANDIGNLVEDLAGLWTDPTVEALKLAGVVHVSVGMEVDAWRSLMRLLQAELPWRLTFRASTMLSVNSFKAQIMWRAALQVAKKHEPLLVDSNFRERIQQMAGARPASASERRLFADLLGRVGLRAAHVGARQTDYIPRLQLAAI